MREIKKEMINDRYVIFQMTKNSIAEVVVFQRMRNHREVDQYFEEECGGVYKWWYAQEVANLQAEVKQLREWKKDVIEAYNDQYDRDDRISSSASSKLHKLLLTQSKP